MSNVPHWTNLPKGMDQDFVSHSGDYDFPLYLSEKEEWVNFKHVKGNITLSEPFLIMELNRFVPYLEDDNVKFHPLNMPYIKIGKIEIVGFVIYVAEDAKYYEIRVDDGTGTISIFYERKSFAITVQQRKRIDDKYRRWVKMKNTKELRKQECPEHFPNPRPRFNYPVGTSIRDMAIFEHNWSLETNNGSLGKRVKQRDYVHALGYCSLDFMFGERSQEEITFTDLSQARMIFYATKVIGISERDYNKKLYSWFSTVVRRRYDERPNKPKCVSHG